MMVLPSLLSYIPKSCAANYCTCLATIFTSLLWVFSPEDKTLNKVEPTSFDFIVVGAGCAGCVVANRLTEIKEWNVLLLEAGGEQPVAAEIPRYFLNFSQTAITWNYTTLAEEGTFLNKGFNFSSGKVMGGTSSISGLAYVRGNKEDYNNWARLGNTGWSYDEVLPYFKKSEDNTDAEIVKQNPGYHSTGGYFTVSKFPFISPTGRKVEEAFNELGYPTRDVNAESQLGIANLQITTNNGVRESTNIAFIRPIRGKRPNLIVKNEVYVTRILIDCKTKKATGVEYKNPRTGKTEVVMANKEIILSAGAILSPKLLMVSGVGPAEELKKHRIKLIQNLPVGQNLHDHFSTDGVDGIIRNVNPDDNVNECKEEVGNFSEYARTRTGTFSTYSPELLTAYIRTKYEENKKIPDISLIPLTSENKITLRTVLLTPNSRGVIKLNAMDPVWGSPLIYPGYLTAEPDLKRIIQGIRIGLSVFNTTTMKKYKFEIDDTPQPPCDKFKFNSDDYWTCLVRQLGRRFQHFVGTCKMGPNGDPTAVVDPRLRVYGIKGLRAIDASVMPVAPRGNTIASTIMIAEKGCDMIKEDWLGKTKKVKNGKWRGSSPYA